MEWGLYVKDGKRSQKRGLKMDKFFKFLFPFTAEKEIEIFLQQPTAVAVFIITLALALALLGSYYVLLFIFREGDIEGKIFPSKYFGEPEVLLGTIILIIVFEFSPPIAVAGFIFTLLIFIRRVKKWK